MDDGFLSKDSCRRSMGKRSDRRTALLFIIPTAHRNKDKAVGRDNERRRAGKKSTNLFLG